MAVSPKFYSRGIYMKKRQKCKALAVLLSVVLSAVVLMPAFKPGLAQQPTHRGLKTTLTIAAQVLAFTTVRRGINLYTAAHIL